MKNESLIVKFFENALSEEERQAFDALMTSDENFRKEVALRQELQEVITLDDRETLKQELQALEQPKTSKKPWLLPVAASVVILLGVSSFWFFGNQAQSTEDLFNSHFEPYRNVVQPIERGDSSASPRVNAFKAYEQGNYTEALNGFNELIKTDNDPTIKFYKANTLLKTGNTEKAIVLLESNMKQTDSLAEKHHWYLALAYIKNGNLEAAKTQLNLLLNNPDSEYKKIESKQLLKHLD